ncbi:unnamed protein product, partial [Protopolystoma xenopodis]
MESCLDSPTSESPPDPEQEAFDSAKNDPTEDQPALFRMSIPNESSETTGNPLLPIDIPFPPFEPTFSTQEPGRQHAERWPLQHWQPSAQRQQQKLSIGRQDQVESLQSPVQPQAALLEYSPRSEEPQQVDPAP